MSTWSSIKEISSYKDYTVEEGGVAFFGVKVCKAYANVYGYVYVLWMVMIGMG